MKPRVIKYNKVAEDALSSLSMDIRAKFDKQVNNISNNSLEFDLSLNSFEKLKPYDDNLFLLTIDSTLRAILKIEKELITVIDIINVNAIKALTAA